MKNGFAAKWLYDGGLNTYYKEFDSYELNFYEDINNQGEIIGESYLFPLNSLENCEDSDSLIIKFDVYRESINAIIDNYKGKIIEPEKLKNYRFLVFKVKSEDGKILNFRIDCYPNRKLMLSTETWYRK